MFEHLADHPAAAAVFDATMAESARIAAEEVATAYDTDWTETIVDLEGGIGTLLAGRLERDPRGRGLVETPSSSAAPAPP